jgi:enamine deaminase RidA (YjgF/YER057c/UK114 family)
MMKRLILSTLIIGLAVLAVTGFAQTSTKVEYFNFPGASEDQVFSTVVLVGDTLYMGAASGVDPATGAPPPDTQDEARIAMEGVKARLALAGMTMDDLVVVRVFCPDRSLVADFNTVYRTYFTDHFPARMFIGSGYLSGGTHFEVSGVAVRR